MAKPRRRQLKETAKKTFLAQCARIDSMLRDKAWIMGDQYTVADPTPWCFNGWGYVRGFRWPTQSLYGLEDRMLKRPTVRKILEASITCW